MTYIFWKFGRYGVMTSNLLGIEVVDQRKYFVSVCICEIERNY